MTYVLKLLVSMVRFYKWEEYWGFHFLFYMYLFMCQILPQKVSGGITEIVKQ